MPTGSHKTVNLEKKISRKWTQIVSTISGRHPATVFAQYSSLSWVKSKKLNFTISWKYGTRVVRDLLPWHPCVHMRNKVCMTNGVTFGYEYTFTVFSCWSWRTSSLLPLPAAASNHSGARQVPSCLVWSEDLYHGTAITLNPQILWYLLLRILD